LRRGKKRKEELAELPTTEEDKNGDRKEELSNLDKKNPALPENVVPAFGDLEEELGLTSEHDLQINGTVNKYSWQDKYWPRKPPYFNRVKTGWDWKKYNQTHCNKDNPLCREISSISFIPTSSIQRKCLNSSWSQHTPMISVSFASLQGLHIKT
jgi:hypothetical protein